jgi:hypothetical protein
MRAVLPALSALLLLSGTAMGADTNSTAVGFYPQTLRISVADPAGDTPSTTTTSFLSAYSQYALGRDRRGTVLLTRYTATYDDTGGDQVGGQVSSTLMTGLYEWRWRLSRTFKPWIGAGVSVARHSYTDRYQTDNDGLLDKRLSDRTASDISLTVSVGHTWFVTDNLAAGARATHTEPILADAEVRTSSLGLLVAYYF